MKTAKILLKMAAVQFVFHGCSGHQVQVNSLDSFSKFNISANAPLRPENFNNIGVIPFVDAVNVDKSGTLIGVQIQNQLDKFGFKTLDGAFLHSSIRERANIVNGLFTEKELKELGSQLHVNYIIYGSVTKYKSTTHETKGNDITVINNTIFGTLATTINAENSIRETYNTGARFKIFNVSKGQDVYEQEISIDSDFWDNLKSFELAFNRHLLLEWVRAKRDSIVDFGIDSAYEITFDSKIRSFKQDDMGIAKLDSNGMHHYYKIISDSSAFFYNSVRTEKVKVIGTIGSKYLFVDGEYFGKSLIDALKFSLAWGDSIACINSISKYPILDQSRKDSLRDMIDRNWNSFSDEDQSEIHERYGLWISDSKKKMPSVFRKRNR